MFQIGSFAGSHLITSSVTIDGKQFGIMNNGKFGRIEFHNAYKSTFIPLWKSKHESVYLRRHFLYDI